MTPSRHSENFDFDLALPLNLSLDGRYAVLYSVQYSP
jgi:hypothetical protein